MIKKYLSLALLAYFRFFARLQLKKNPQAIIIGITGSSGKTSTRLALAQILATHGRVKHSAHANSESGIPLNILGITMHHYSFITWLKVIFLVPWRYLTFREAYDYYIVEMGIDGPDIPKNMQYLLTIVRPDVAVVTGIGLAHAEAFSKLVKDKNTVRKIKRIRYLIGQEKMRLAHVITSRGIVVLNADDAVIKNHQQGLRGRLVTFGLSPDASFRIKNIRLGSFGFRAEIIHESHLYKLHLADAFGPDYGHTFVAALSTAHSLGMPLSKCLAALANYRAPAGRMRLFAGINHTHLLDSSYNASPATMKSALMTLSSLAKSPKRIAVLGDMRELGVLGKSLHQELARSIPSYVDEVYLFGPIMQTYVYPYLKRKLGGRAHHFDTMSALIKTLKERLKPHDYILFKGSQNNLFLERAVSALLNDKSDQKYLCRRGQYWDKIRQNTP